MWALTLLVSLPLTLVLRGMLAAHLGSSLAADTAAAGVNYDWMQEFADQATGLGVTFKPTIIGFGAVLDNLSAFIDDTARPVVIVGAASAYIVLWIFVAGGIIDRYARDRATRAHGFFSASGVFFFRFLRLAVVQWIVYAFLFGYRARLAVRSPVSADHARSHRRADRVLRARSRCTSSSGLCSPRARSSSITRRSARSSRIAAACSARSVAALGFIRRNAGGRGRSVRANFAMFAASSALYALVAPGAGGGGPSIWIGFAIGQLYIAARLWVKLVFWASETALFQSRLAHAGYVARPSRLARIASGGA